MSLFREGVSINEAVFGRSEELWVIMLRCWEIDPNRRPHAWNIKKMIANLCANPEKQTKGENDGDASGYVNSFGEALSTQPNQQMNPARPAGETDRTSKVFSDTLSP